MNLHVFFHIPILQSRKRHPFLRVGYIIRYIQIEPSCRFRIRIVTYPCLIHAASVQKIDTGRVEYYLSILVKKVFLHDPPVYLILALFRIRDVLLRIRICGSVSLDFGFGFCSFLQRLSRCPQLKSFSLSFFSLLPLVFTSVRTVQDNKLLRSHKTEKIKVFLIFIAVDV